MKWLNATRHSRSVRAHRMGSARRKVGGRAFSLVEVMIGIFILGIGVIAISALFPAGIAQQQYSNDDIIGPIVANNAMAVIRGKVSAADFGTLEEFGLSSSTVNGDWGWSRPAFFFTPTTISINGNNYVVLGGTTSVFDHVDAGTISEIPWSQRIYGLNAPDPPILITQRERYFPMQSESAGSNDHPQYVWDCMFKRFEGRMYVAIFVYRVSDPEAAANGPYRVAGPASADDSDIPPMPRHVALYDTSSLGPTNFGLWEADVNPVPGVTPAADINNRLDPDDQNLAWQDARQWLVDQNTNIHRVLSYYDLQDGSPLQVELVRPPSAMPPVPTNFLPIPPAGSQQRPVSDIWFVPLVDSAGRSLTPVYATVQEL